MLLFHEHKKTSYFLNFPLVSWTNSFSPARIASGSVTLGQMRVSHDEIKFGDTDKDSFYFNIESELNIWIT